MCTHDVLTALLHKGETMNIELKARGLCVRDLSQSVRFYQDALGFVPQCPAHAINASRLPGSGELGAAQGHLQSMRNAQGVELLLSELKHPHPGGPAERRPNNQYGLTHLAFWVDDIQRSAECVVAAGGRVYPHTRAYFAEARVTLMYATDPNGIRVELMHSAQEAERFSHSGICTVAIDAALDFYSGLDFTQAERFDLQGEWLDTINELEGIQLSAQMARNTQGPGPRCASVAARTGGRHLQACDARRACFPARSRTTPGSWGDSTAPRAGRPPPGACRTRSSIT